MNVLRDTLCDDATVKPPEPDTTASRRTDPSYMISGEVDDTRPASQRMFNYMESPIGTIPAELLAIIFVHLVEGLAEEHGTSNLQPYYDAASAPWMMCKVCCFWRNVALTSRSLWATIVVLPPLSTRYFALSTSALLRTRSIVEIHLERSARLPLSVHLGGFSNHYYHPTLHSIIDILSNQSYRWKSVNLFRLEPNLLWGFNSVKGCVPLLESLHINVSASPFIGRNLYKPGRFDAFALCPSLRDFETNIPICCPGLPFSKLTRYAALVNLPEQSDVLMQVHSLTHLRLTSSPASISLPTMITLHHLRTLDVAGNVKTLDNIAAPVLRTLTLTIQSEHRHTNREHLLSFIQRSSFTLSSLTLATRALPAWDIAEILHELASITALRIETDDTDERFQLELASDEELGRHTRLQNVKTFHLGGCFELLNYITIPMLQHLGLAGYLGYHSQSLLSFIGRSSAPPSSLDIARLDAPDAEVIALLHAFPGLASLTVRESVLLLFATNPVTQ